MSTTAPPRPRHPALPDAGEAMPAEILRALIDPRLGVIRELEHTVLPAHLPSGLQQWTTAISDTTRFSPWAADTAGAGTTFWDRQAAIAAAVGESVERYCANLVPEGLPQASYEELVAAGEEAIDPTTLSLYSAEQYATAGFPFVPFTRDLSVRWVRGRHLLSGRGTWVPAPTVWITYYEGDQTAAEARTNALVHAGVAAGRDRVHADWSALTELVERDAMTLAWTGRRPLFLVRPPAAIAALAAGPAGRLDVRFLLFPSDVGIPALGALMIDRETGWTCLGTACRTDLEQAMLKALAEAVQMQLILVRMDSSTGPFAAIAGTPTSPLKPFRPDRDYLDLYRPDWRDATHHACHLQAYLDPRTLDLLEAELAEVPELPVEVLGDPDGAHHLVRPLRAADPGARLQELALRLEECGHPAYSIDLTTDDIRPTGLRVTRVTAPGLYSYAAAAFPCLGGRRLAEALGGRPPRLLPLPH